MLSAIEIAMICELVALVVFRLLVELDYRSHGDDIFSKLSSFFAHAFLADFIVLFLTCVIYVVNLW